MMLNKKNNIILYKNNAIILIKNIKNKYQVNDITQQISHTNYFKIKLVGVGFKVRMFYIKCSGKRFLQLFLGKSHKIFIQIPKNIIVQSKKNLIKLSCNNSQKLNLFIVCLKSYYHSNVFNNKGIFFIDETKLIKKTKKKK